MEKSCLVNMAPDPACGDPISNPLKSGIICNRFQLLLNTQVYKKIQNQFATTEQCRFNFSGKSCLSRTAPEEFANRVTAAEQARKQEEEEEKGKQFSMPTKPKHSKSGMVKEKVESTVGI